MMNSSVPRFSDPSSADDDRPNFAVIRLKAESNLLGLFQLLLCNGFGEVAFVKNLNDANFGGNNTGGGGCKERANTSSSSGATATASVPQEFEESNFVGGTCNGNLSPTKSSIEQATKHSKLLENSIQKLICAKKQRLAATKQAIGEKATATDRNTVGGENGAAGCGAANSANRGLGTRASEMVRSIDPLLAHSGSLSLVLKNTEKSLSTNQSSSPFGPSSPPLPLSTFSCPLPLPVDRSNTASVTQKSNTTASIQKKSTASKPKTISSAPKSISITPKLLPAPPPSAAPTATASIRSTRPIVQRSTGKNVSPPKQERSSPSGSSIFIQCHLCQSKIMATRFSNLTNHVRRHAPMKQFQCVYCDYAHNEIAKVRLHMTNNHGDKKSRPLNNINMEMQDTWRRLMRECFPERSKRQKAPKLIPPQQPQQNASVSATAIISSQGASFSRNSMDRLKNGQNRSTDQVKSMKSENAADMVLTALNYSPLEEEDDSSGAYQFEVDNNEKTGNADGTELRFARCDQCYAYVDVNMKESHVRACHMENVPSITYVCSVCGLENIDRRQLEIHIQIEHDQSDRAEIRTVSADLSGYVDQLIDEYFPLDALEYTSNFEKISAGNADGNVDFDHMIFSSGSFGAATVNNGIDHHPIAINNGANSRSITDGDQVDVGCAQLKFGDHYNYRAFSSTMANVKCRVCRRRMRAHEISKHARKHLSASMVIFECPICSNYRTSAIERVSRHLIDQHQAVDGDEKPRIVRHRRIPATGLDNVISGAIKRCFGITGRFGYKRKYFYKRPIPAVRSRKCAKN